MSKTRPCSPDTHGMKEAESVVRMFALRNNMSRVLVLGDILLGGPLDYPVFTSGALLEG